MIQTYLLYEKYIINKKRKYDFHLIKLGNQERFIPTSRYDLFPVFSYQAGAHLMPLLVVRDRPTSAL